MKRILFAGILAGCSSPTMRLSLNLETGEAVTGSYSMQKGGSSYSTTNSTDTIAAALAGALPTPSATPIQQ